MMGGKGSGRVPVEPKIRITLRIPTSQYHRLREHGSIQDVVMRAVTAMHGGPGDPPDPPARDNDYLYIPSENFLGYKFALYDGEDWAAGPRDKNRFCQFKNAALYRNMTAAKLARNVLNKTTYRSSWHPVRVHCYGERID